MTVLLLLNIPTLNKRFSKRNMATKMRIKVRSKKQSVTFFALVAKNSSSISELNFIWTKHAETTEVNEEHQKGPNT